jgi:MSHA biogenesis protein MshP
MKCKSQRKAKGFALASAIFLIVVLAALGAFLVNMRATQDSSVALDTLGQRAYDAARAGIEWGAYQSLRNNACVAGPIAFNLAGGALAGHTVNVSCARTAHNEGGIAINMDTITATACNQAPCPNAGPVPPVNYAERQLTVTLAR